MFNEISEKMINDTYQLAEKRYSQLGIDVDAVMKKNGGFIHISSLLAR